MTDAQDPVEQRAGRGRPRGAEVVLAAARADADRSAPRRRTTGWVVGAVAAAGTLLVGALVVTREDDQPVAAPGATTTTEPAGPVVAQSEASLVLYDSCPAVLASLQAEALERVGPFGLQGSSDYWGFRRGSFSPNLQEQSGQRDFASGTNTQEAGIDEPDLVETDGERLYDVTGGTLHVVDAATATLEATLPLGLVDVTGAVLVGDQLVVLADEPLTGAGGGEAQVVVIDVSADPVVGERLRTDGSIVDARVVEGRVHLVVRSSPSLAFTYPANASEPGLAEAATAANQARVRASTLEDWLPSVTITGADGTVVTDREQLTDCDAIRHPATFGGFDQTTLVTLDLDALAASDATSVQASSLLVYSSATSLYTTSTEIDDLVAWDDEAPRPPPSEPHTDIHRFSLEGIPTYVGSGRVTGYVGTNLGMSEHAGHLRVVTSSWVDATRSLLTVLRVDPGELVPRGVLDGLGIDEVLQGVRFVDDLAYVVTFRRIDPLHVLDLRDPNAPRLAGVLEVPGYSSYLHPVGDGWLLGLGQDGTPQGVLTGGAASLIDVRDIAAPARTAVVGFGELSGPLAERDPHAFTWWPATSTAYVPIGTLGGGGRIAVLHIDGASLMLVGEIVPTGEGASAASGLDRVVIVGDRLLAAGPDGVQVSERATLAPIAWVPYR